MSDYTKNELAKRHAEYRRPEYPLFDGLYEIRIEQITRERDEARRLAEDLYDYVFYDASDENRQALFNKIEALRLPWELSK